MIDDAGKPTDLAVKWRDDAEYPEVCKTIREAVYPQALRDVAPDSSHKDEARRWFGSHGVGEAMVNKASSLYMLLCEANPTPPARAERPSNGTASRVGRTRPAPRIRERQEAANVGDGDHVEDRLPPVRRLAGPTLHLNVQVHISPEVSVEQIDAIFASMAKHLKNMSE